MTKKWGSHLQGGCKNWFIKLNTLKTKMAPLKSLVIPGLVEGIRRSDIVGLLILKYIIFYEGVFFYIHFLNATGARWTLRLDIQFL